MDNSFDDAATTMAIVLKDSGHNEDAHDVLSLVNHAEGVVGVCVAADALADFDLLHNVPTSDLQIVPYVAKKYGYDHADSSARAELQRRGVGIEADENEDIEG